MKTIILIVALVLSGMLIVAGCNDDDVVAYPSLKVENQNSEMTKPVISYVELVGYTFNNLNIDVGDSQTFTLENGMPGGCDSIFLTVRYSTTYVTRSISRDVNFSDGQTTVVTLKGCSGAEGCPGISLEYNP